MHNAIKSIGIIINLQNKFGVVNTYSKFSPNVKFTVIKLNGLVIQGGPKRS